MTSESNHKIELPPRPLEILVLGTQVPSVHKENVGLILPTEVPEKR